MRKVRGFGLSLPILERCEYLAQQIEKLNPNAQTRVEPYGISSCLVTFEDTKLVKELVKAGKLVGTWSSEGSAYIDESGKITESDIPVSLQKCTQIGKTNVDEIDLGDLAKVCRVYAVHIHDGKGNPSVHLRLHCLNSEISTLYRFAEVVMQAQKISRAICEGVQTRDIEEFQIIV